MLRLVLLLLGPLIGIALGIWLRNRLPRLRLPLISLLGIAVVVIVVAAALSLIYPGPAEQYTPGAFAWVVRERFVYPSGMAAFGLPMLLSVAICYLMPPDASARRTAVFAGLAGYLSIPMVLGALLFIGCNYAGACL